MQGKIDKTLYEWKNASSKNPLIISGPTMVGKSYSVINFGRTQYQNYIYVNLEFNPVVVSLLSKETNIDRLFEKLCLLYNIKGDNNNTLIIFDNVDKYEKIISVLIRFKEWPIEYDVISICDNIVLPTNNTSYVGKNTFIKMTKIDFDEFLKNISSRTNRYQYLKKALKESDEGIYIGKEQRLSDEFLKKYDEKLKMMCEKITRANCYFSHLNDEKSDIAQEAFILIMERGGSIEKTFSYDKELLFALLGKKVKCFVIGKRNQRYQNILLDNFDFYIRSYDEYNILHEDLEEFFDSVD